MVVSTVEPILDNRRSSFLLDRRCPDITIESMVEKGGLLPLVRYIARSGRIHKGRDYHPVISPDFDRTNGTKRNVIIDESIPFDRAARHMQLLTEQSTLLATSI